MIRLCPVCGDPLPAGKVRHVPHCRDYHEAGLRARMKDLQSGWEMGGSVPCEGCGGEWDTVSTSHKILKGKLVCTARQCSRCFELAIPGKRPLAGNGLCATHLREARK